MPQVIACASDAPLQEALRRIRRHGIIPEQGEITMSELVQFEDSHSTWTVEIDRDTDQPQLRMMRVGRGIENMDREFDEAFWQALGSSAISLAACELVEQYLISKGRADDIRLQRSVGGLKRVRRTVSHRGRTRGDEIHGTPSHKGS